jgi:5'-3' exonuclease
MLSTGLDTIYLMREANKMDSNMTDIINFISLKTMKTCIVDSFSNIIEKNIDKSVRFKISNEKIIDDFIFICSLMGNDFLPHMPALDIYDHAIDRLMETYVDILITNNYIIDRTSPDLINNDIFYKFIVKLASMEEETIVVNYGKKKRIPYCISKEPYEIEIFRIENMIFKYNDPIRLGDGNMSMWRERYYKHHYMVEKEECDEFANNMAYHYMIGLKWVTMYYLDKCPSWDWYYPFDHAPFLNDMVIKMKDNIFNMIQFKDSVQLSPLMQLLIVLPKDTSYLLPEILRKIMTNTNSSAAHLYPSKFELDMIGKKKYWMCNPILPNLEINLIKKIFEKYYPMLSSDVKEYDKMGENIILI